MRKTKTTPATKSASNGTIPITPSVYRLAKQLKKDPEALARRILEAGIEAIDDSIGHNVDVDFDPILFSTMQAKYSFDHRWTISGLIESMDPEELADLQKDADDCEQTLQEIVQELATRNSDMERLQ